MRISAQARHAALALAAFLLIANPATQAANYPCSGKKGGVSHCAGSTFVCNDGSASGSKRNCSAELGGTAVQRALAAPAREASRTPHAADGCSCRSGKVCTGPRGGRYCTNESGNKSYIKR